MATTELVGNWNYPSHISAGAGRIEVLADSCKALQIRAPLLITDPGLAELAVVQRAQQDCRQAGLDCRVFSAIRGNPTGEDVMAGVAAYRAADSDGVIAFGGGSALDAGKAVALMVGQDRPLWDFEDLGDNWLRVNEDGMAAVVAVPTTAGTGSEVGRASVITDSDARRKKIIFHPDMLPARVILDPGLTVGLPAPLTAATGMDALSHSLEALCAPAYHPLAEGIAVEGIRLVKDWLPVAVADGANLEARMHMLVASTMGATAFQKGLGAMHALAHPLGALYDAHHGMLNAVLMPYVLLANRAAIESKIARLAAYLELGDKSFDGFMVWLLAMRKQIGIPDHLAAIGVPAKDSALVAELALQDPSAGGNPVQLSAGEYEQLFLRACKGSL